MSSQPITIHHIIPGCNSAKATTAGFCLLCACLQTPVCPTVCIKPPFTPKKLMMNTKNFNTRDPRRATYPFLRRSNTARKGNQTMNESEKGTGLIRFLAPTKTHPFPYLQNQFIATHLSSFTHDKGTRGCKMKIFISSAKTNIPTSHQLHTGRQQVLIYQPHSCCSRCQALLI